MEDAEQQANAYLIISGMPVASSQYWNSVHGRTCLDTFHIRLIKKIRKSLLKRVIF